MTDNTFTITVTLPVTMDVTSRGQAVTIDIQKAIATHGADMVADGFLHGAHQKIGDAAASALKAAFEADGGDKDATTTQRKAWLALDPANVDATDATALNLMESATRNLVENGWTARRATTSGDPLDPYRIAEVRKIILGAKKGPAWNGYSAIDAKDQTARRDYLLAIATKNAAAIDPLAKLAMQADIDEAKRTASIKLEL
jgi:hypothetical protein